METLLIPPIFKTTVAKLGFENTALWKAGTRGAPCPPKAISLRRKSPITDIPVFAANKFISPSCIVKGNAEAGECHTVCP